MKALLVLFVVSIGMISYSQSTIAYQCTLSDSIFESSGLIMVGGKLVTHNDSGDDSYLYELDTISGVVTRAVYVEASTSVDWEDVATDNDYIYIADMGNNSGDRTDLMIFRVLISDFISTPNDTVSCDTLYFSYEDQIDFTPAVYETNFDAEALIAYNDSLYIFTKNWMNQKTNVYGLGKLPGTYVASFLDSIDTDGLITGGSYDPVNNEIVLCGHTAKPFVYLIRNITSSDFNAANAWRIEPSITASTQTEGVTTNTAGCYFISSEKMAFGGGSASLHKLCLYDDVGLIQMPLSQFVFYPNPADEWIGFGGPCAYMVLTAMNGEVIDRSPGDFLNIQGVQSGTYIITAYSTESTVVQQAQLFIR